jgi:hypothetical protein
MRVRLSVCVCFLVRNKRKEKMKQANLKRKKTGITFALLDVIIKPSSTFSTD